MTNVLKLEEAINSKGIKKSSIAEALGLSRQGLYKKLNGISQFNQTEIGILCKMLKIDSLDEVDAIFFSSFVDR